MLSRLSIVSVLACLTLMLGACEEQSSAPHSAVPATPTADHHADDDHAAPHDAVKAATGKAHDHAAHEAVKTTTAQATAAADTWVAKAQPLLDQATQYVKDHKYELAQQTLTKLGEFKAHLPTSMQDQIGSLQKLVDAAKLSGVKLPGM